MADKPDLTPLLANMTDEQREQFMAQYDSKKKNRTTAFLLAFFLGGLGIGRFYIGNVGIGVLKLLTGGVFGILAIVDWFLIWGLTDKVNFKLAMGIADSLGVSPGGAPGEDVGALRAEGAKPVTAGPAAAHAAGPPPSGPVTEPSYMLAGILGIVAVLLVIVVLLLQWSEWDFYRDAWPRLLFRG